MPRRTLTRRVLLQTAAGVAAAGVLASCAPSGTTATGPSGEQEGVPAAAVEAGQKTVVVWAWPGFVDPLRGLVPDFNAIHPEITIDFQQMAWADVHNKLVTALAAGTGAPDIAGLSDYKIGDMAGIGGGLADLTEWMAPYERDFAPVHWAELYKDGKIWAVPADASPVIVYYHKNVLDEWGLDLEGVEVWADFILLGQQVREASGGSSYLMGMQPGVVGIHQDLAGQIGGAIFNVDGETVVDDEANLSALKLMISLAESETAVTDVTDAAWNAGLKDGSLICYLMPAWFMFTMRQQAPETSGAWRAIKLPAYTPGGSRASDDGGANLAITEQSQSKEAAWAYLEFCQCTKEGQLKQFTDFELFPTFLPALEDPAFDEPVEFFGGQPIRRLLAEVAAEAPPIWRGANYMEARDILSLELQAAIAGEKTPEKALEDAAAAIRAKTG